MLSSTDHDLLIKLITQMEERHRVADGRFDSLQVQVSDLRASLSQHIENLQDLVSSNNHSSLAANGGWAAAGAATFTAVGAILKAAGVW